MTRGFSAVGLVRPKHPENVGGAIRAAFNYDARLVAIAGARTFTKKGIRHCTNTLKAERHIPVTRGETIRELVPFGAIPVAVELVDGACPLHAYQHPQSAFYIFGPEDGTLGGDMWGWCDHRVMVPTRNCMNLQATVNVVLYDRQAKQLRASRKIAA